jgi:hypothetical protein
MKLIHMLCGIIFSMIVLTTNALANSSACGGSANNPCDCTDRYVCDNGNCACQGDQYCADTNCNNLNGKFLKNKLQYSQSTMPSAPIISGPTHGHLSPDQNPSKPEQQLMQIDIKGVGMSCSASEGGHRITVYASNSESRNRQCSSTCYYKNSLGQGTLSGSGTVPAKANNVTFLSAYSASLTYVVTNPGSFSCQ